MQRRPRVFCEPRSVLLWWALPDAVEVPRLVPEPVTLRVGVLRPVVVAALVGEPLWVPTKEAVSPPVAVYESWPEGVGDSEDGPVADAEAVALI